MLQRVRNFLLQKKVDILFFRIGIAFIQIIVFQQLTVRYGVEFIGEYSKIIVPITFVAAIFSFGILNYYSYLMSVDRKNIYEINRISISIFFINVVTGVFAVGIIYMNGIRDFLTLGVSYLVYISFCLNIIIYAYLLSLKKYLKQILIQFGSLILYLISILIFKELELLNLVILILISNLCVTIINIRILKFVLKNMNDINIWYIFTDARRLFSSFSADATSYLFQRSDFLLFQMSSSNSLLIGVYYFFLQIKEGTMHITKAYSPIILREFRSNPKISFNLSIVVAVIILLGLVASLLFWDYWIVYLSEDLLPFYDLYLLWCIIIFFYNLIILVRSVLYSMGAFKMAFKLNSIFTIFLCLNVLYYVYSGETDFDRFILIKFILTFIAFGCFMYFLFRDFKSKGIKNY